MQQTVDPSGGHIKCICNVLLTLILNLHLNVSFKQRNMYAFVEEFYAGSI